MKILWFLVEQSSPFPTFCNSLEIIFVSLCWVGSDQVNFQLEPLLSCDQPSSFYAQMTLIQREPLELARRTWVLDLVHIFCCFRLLANENPYFLVPSPIELQCAGWQADKALDTFLLNWLDAKIKHFFASEILSFHQRD